MCIASVIRNSKEVYVEPYITRVMNAFQKTFQAPSCPSKPQILNALGDLMEVYILNLRVSFSSANKENSKCRTTYFYSHFDL